MVLLMGYITPVFSCLKHCFSRLQPTYGKPVHGQFFSVRFHAFCECSCLFLVLHHPSCGVRLGLSLLCSSLLYRPVFATLARCAHLIRLPLPCISAPPPALAHAWCMLVPAFCSSLPVPVSAHHSGSSGVERAEFTPYPSEPIEKTYPIQMVKGVFLRIVSVCVCVTIRTSGGSFYRLPITHRTNPAIAGTVIHPHVYHVTTCNLKADIRGSDQSAVHVLPRTPSISSAWRGCGACPPFEYRKTRLILWQCVC